MSRSPSPAEKRDSRTHDHYVRHEHSPHYYEDRRSRSYSSGNSPDDQSRYVKRSPPTSTKMDPHSPPPHKKPRHEPRQPTEHSPNCCLIKCPSCQHYDHEHAQSPDGQNPTAVKENIKETVPEPKRVFEIFKKGFRPPPVKKEPQTTEKEDDVYIQVYFRKSELERYCDYEGSVTEGETSGALFTICQDCIPSEGGDANLAKKRYVDELILQNNFLCPVRYTKDLTNIWIIYLIKDPW